MGYYNWARVNNGRIAQLGEHLPYKQGVIGSSPIATTIIWGCSSVWLERMPVTHEVASSILVTPAITSAQIAQSVEQGTENPRVSGSIPLLGTIESLIYMATSPSGKAEVCKISTISSNLIVASIQRITAWKELFFYFLYL